LLQLSRYNKAELCLYITYQCTCQDEVELRNHHWSIWCDQKPMWERSFARMEHPLASVGWHRVQKTIVKPK